MSARPSTQAATGVFHRYFFDVLHASGLWSSQLRSRNAEACGFRSSAEAHYGHAAGFQALWGLRTTLADRSRASRMRCTLHAADAYASRLRVACTTCIMPVSQFFFSAAAMLVFAFPAQRKNSTLFSSLTPRDTSRIIPPPATPDARCMRLQRTSHINSHRLVPLMRLQPPKPQLYIHALTPRPNRKSTYPLLSPPLSFLILISPNKGHLGMPHH